MPRLFNKYQRNPNMVLNTEIFSKYLLMTHGVVLNLQTQIAELVWYCAIGPQLPGPELLFLKVHLSCKNSLVYFAAAFQLQRPAAIAFASTNFTEHQLHAIAQQEDQPSNIC